MGYHRAGFEIVGVDIAPQPDYPFRFWQTDVFALEPWVYAAFDAIHASPPCQFHTTLSSRWRAKTGSLASTRVNLLTPTLAKLRGLSQPWVCENVVGARPFMAPTLLLHGGMFGLGVHRPRLFESNCLLLAPLAPKAASIVGVYGRAPDGRPVNSRNAITFCAASLAEAQEALGMAWGDWNGVREAIPPAYTELIGSQLRAYIDP